MTATAFLKVELCHVVIVIDIVVEVAIFVIKKIIDLLNKRL